MTQEEMQSLIATLDSLEVRGKENLQKVLGCLYVLEEVQLRSAAQAQAEKIAQAAKEEEANGGQADI